MEQLTAKQQQILEYIRDCMDEQGMPPTVEEIRQFMNVSSANGIRDHLRALERKGAIELVPGISRGIRLMGELSSSHDLPHTTISLPIIGRVAAGSPILAEQHVEDQRQLDAALFRPRADFLLRVVGTSMKDVGIFEGDLLAVHKTDQVNNGQIVIARVDDEVTVKRFERKGHTAYLHAENPEYAPIVVDLRRQPLAIEGVVVGMVRSI